MKEIGDYFGLHYSNISKIINGQPNVNSKVKA